MTTSRSESILALDLGTHTGWALLVDGRVVSGVWNLKGSRFEGGGMRYLRFRGMVQELRNHCGFERVVFEEVRRHTATDAAHVYGGLLATLTAWCEEHSCPYLGVPVGTIKKHATGNGRSGKPAMIASARARGWTLRDDNEADALWLLDWARSQERAA